MLIIPAIDIKDGHCVRLKQGDMADATVFSDDPVAMAMQWGAGRTPAAHRRPQRRAPGKPSNEAAIKQIIRAAGGEIPCNWAAACAIWTRSSASSMAAWLSSSSARRPSRTRASCTTRAAPSAGHIIVALDAKEGKVATDGWSKLTGHDVIDLATKFEDYGVDAILYTDIGRDGMLSGVNIEATVALARAVRIPVLASGGIADISDVDRLCAVESDGIEGVILGRALYEGTLDFKAAVARAAALAQAQE